MVGAENVGKSSLINQFISAEDKAGAPSGAAIGGSGDKLGAIISSIRKISVDGKEYELELIECEEFRYYNKEIQ